GLHDQRVPADARADAAVGRARRDPWPEVGPVSSAQESGAQGSGRPLNAGDFAAWIGRAAELVAAAADRLTRLDAAIGDGDHGHNMDRGLRAATEALSGLPEDAPPGKVLITAGRAIVSRTGGASGPLYGTALRRAGKALGDAAEVDAAALGS